jgi:hypothetical protein
MARLLMVLAAVLCVAASLAAASCPSVEARYSSIDRLVVAWSVENIHDVVGCEWAILSQSDLDAFGSETCVSHVNTHIGTYQ